MTRCQTILINRPPQGGFILHKFVDIDLKSVNIPQELSDKRLNKSPTIFIRISLWPSIFMQNQS